MPQSPRSSRRQKIEPLNWAEEAQAPALKGGISFLELSPENVRAGRFESYGPIVVHAEATSAAPTSPANELTPGDETVLPSRKALGASVRRKRVPTTPANARSASSGWPKSLTSPSSLPARDVKTSAPVMTPGDETYAAYETAAEYGADVTLAGERSVTAPSRFTAVATSVHHVISPGDETYPAHLSTTSLNITPGRGRSKVRRCVLAQDGHSLGEEAIYQVMWRGGRAENGDPNGSRAIRIGAADIGYKVNMAKKNVRQNVSRLFEKLALEIIEDFETSSSQARLYRVFSYKQILERRRAAGLEYVLRNKGVVFCTANGEELVSSPAYVLTPGDETSIKPAPPKKRRPAYMAQENALMPLASTYTRGGSEEDTEVEIVSAALNRYWTVDEAAADQLLRSCRKVRPDARVEEIAFFVREKLELARQNKGITNPTGLIIATVPQSFAGKSFEEFRKRMQRQAALAAEEGQRRQAQEAEQQAWMLKERDRNEAILDNPLSTQAQRDSAEKALRQIASWT